MSYDLAALEQRFAQQLQGDAEDFAAALVTAGWLLGAGRRAAAAALREQAAARGIDLEGLLQRRLTETMADLARTTGAERGLRIAQAQGLYRLAQHWGLAVDAAAWVETRAASLPFDLEAREWLAAWRAECPQDPADPDTWAVVAYPLAALAAPWAPAPPRFECRLTRRSEARLAPYSLDELLQGAAYAATVPPRLKQLFDTVRMQLELPGALHGRVIVQRQLMEDWTALLEVEAPQPVVAARLQVLPFVRQGPQLWAATALTRAHRQLICTVAPITVELLDGTRLILR